MLSTAAAGFIYFNKARRLTLVDFSMRTTSNNKQIAYSDFFCSFEPDFLPKGIEDHDGEKPDTLNSFNSITNLHEPYLKTIYKSQNNTN